MSEAHGERRSWFLVLAVFFANLFLVTFAADAVISLIEDVQILGADNAGVDVARLAIGGLELMLALLMFFLLTFVPHLPKIVLLPPLLVILWQTVGAPPVAWSVADRSTWLPIDAVQLVFAVLAFLTMRTFYGTWLLSAEQLPHKSHLLLRTLIAIPVSLAMTAVLAAGILLGVFVFYLEDQTHGYLRFAWRGVEVQETVMQRGDKVVHLAATVHLADPSFYTDLYRRIPVGSLILAEGVSDREGKLKRGLSYNNAAQALGLESQAMFEGLLGPDSAPTDAPGQTRGDEGKPAQKAPSQTLPPAAGGPKLRPDVVHADIDVADLSPVTLRFIDGVCALYASRNLQDFMRRFETLSQEFTDADIKAVMDDIVRKRNARVLGELDKRLPDYRTVFIPWGAMHMHDMELELQKRGFRVVGRQMHPLARYRTIIDTLFDRGRGQAAYERPGLRLSSAQVGEPRGRLSKRAELRAAHPAGDPAFHPTGARVLP